MIAESARALESPLLRIGAIKSLVQLFKMGLLTILTVDDQVVVVVVLLAGRCAFLTIW